MLNSPDSWKAAIKSKEGEGHKYDYGYVVLCAGPRMTGAAALAAKAALRMGAGVVAIAAHPDISNIFRSFSPSLIIEDMKHISDFAQHLGEDRRNTILIGPGAGQDDPKALQKAVLNALKLQKITVIDADALSVFKDRPEDLLDSLHAACVLTPHSGEFEKLFPGLKGTQEEKALEAAKICGAIIVLKGQKTVIAAPDGRFAVNMNGTGWLATAGSGDVLAGMVAGLGAWHRDRLYEAACASVWMHGRAAELAGSGMIAEDLEKFIGQVWRELRV